MKLSKCQTCWKSFIWACPLLIEIPKNIISCSAYEPSDVYIKEQELINKIIDDLKGLSTKIHSGIHLEVVYKDYIDLIEKYEAMKNEI